MSIVDDVLKHHGTKGMKWGVRRDPITGVRPIARTLDQSRFGRRANANAERYMAKQTAKGDKKWEKKATSPKTFIKIYNHAADKMNSTHIARINAKPEHKLVNLHDPSKKKINDRYVKDYENTFNRLLKEGSSIHAGASPSGKRFGLKMDMQTGNFKGYVIEKNAQHADGGEEFTFTVDKRTGKFASVELNSMTQSTLDVGLDFLEHHGIKGMKWGVRRSKAGGSIVSHPSSHDAKSAKDLRTQAKKHGTSSLTNQELQSLTKRMNLEQQYSNLAGTSTGRKVVNEGQKVVKDVLINVGKQTATNILVNQVAKQLPAALLKK